MLNGNRFGAARSIAEEWNGMAWGRAAARWASNSRGWSTDGGEHRLNTANSTSSHIASFTTADFPAVFSLSSLDGTNGFVIHGINKGDQSGYSLSSAGDVNHDGYDDVIIGAPTRNPGERSRAGESYVVFGKADGFAADLDLSSLDGTNGFRLDGVEKGGNNGWSASSAGDVNGDGVDDFIIGAQQGSSGPGGNSRTGHGYVVFGNPDGFSAVFDLRSLDGTNGFRIDGIDYLDFVGSSVSSAGDINGDGFDDMIIGARGGDPGGDSSAGESYVVFGKANGFAAILNLATLDGSNGFCIEGIDRFDYSGYSVSAGGDVNGDGFDDIIIGAKRGDPGGDGEAGESYIVFGKMSGFTATLDLATLDGTNGFRLDGIDPYDYSGRSVSSAGDVNGDGFDDIIIGASGGDPGGDSDAGESYVVFGKAAGFAASLDLATLDGSNGFRIEGIDFEDRSGRSVSSAGDVNGDGFDDIIISSGADPLGENYVVFGKAGGFSASLDLASLDGTNGFRLEGVSAKNRTGGEVSAAGDVNGDGFDDILLHGAGGGGVFSKGETYVVFGVAPTTAVTRTGSAADQTIRGGDFDDMLNGAGGNDRLGGGAGADALNGGSGNDWAYYDTADAGVRASLDAPVNNIGDAAGDSYVSIENLFGSRFDDTLTGDALGNRIRGEDSADALSGRGGGDTLIGGAGHDTLEGGTGADRFTFGSLDAADSDTISDFVSGLDKVALDDNVFGFAEGALPPGTFVIGGAAQDADDRVIYDAPTGQLYFDADGTGAAAQVLIATLTGAPTLAASDVIVV